MSYPFKKYFAAGLTVAILIIFMITLGNSLWMWFSGKSAPTGTTGRRQLVSLVLADVLCVIWFVCTVFLFKMHMHCALFVTLGFLSSPSVESSI